MVSAIESGESVRGVSLSLTLAFALGATFSFDLLGGWLRQDVRELDGILQDVGAGLLECDSCSHLHCHLPGKGVPGLLDLWDAVCVPPDELFESLDVVVDVGFFSNVVEDPSPLDGIEAVHDHEESVWILINLVLFDECLSLGVNGENGLVLLVTGAVVDATCCGEVSML